MEKKIKIQTDANSSVNITTTTKIIEKRTILTDPRNLDKEVITNKSYFTLKDNPFKFEHGSADKNILNLNESHFKFKQTTEQKSVINSESKIIYSESKNTVKITTSDFKNKNNFYNSMNNNLTNSNSNSNNLLDCLHLFQFIDKEHSSNNNSCTSHINDNINTEKTFGTTINGSLTIENTSTHVGGSNGGNNSIVLERDFNNYEINDITLDFLNENANKLRTKELENFNFGKYDYSSIRDYVYFSLEINQYFKKQSKFMKKLKIFSQTIRLSKYVVFYFKQMILEKAEFISDIGHLQKLLIDEINKEAELLNLNQLHRQELELNDSETVLKNSNDLSNPSLLDSNPLSPDTEISENLNDNVTSKKAQAIISNILNLANDKNKNVEYYGTSKDSKDNSANFLEEAKIYLEIIMEINENNIEEKIIKMFTYEGFLYYRLNWVLREKKELYTKLNLYLLLLIGAISKKGELTSKKIIKEKGLMRFSQKNNRKFIQFFKGSYLDEKTINAYIQNLLKKSN